MAGFPSSGGDRVGSGLVKSEGEGLGGGGRGWEVGGGVGWWCTIHLAQLHHTSQPEQFKLNTCTDKFCHVVYNNYS